MSDELHRVFVQESRELLAEMEAGLLRMERGDDDPETLNAVFRAAHTIKGAAGVVELTAIEAFTHVLENLLDRLRTGEMPVSGELISVLLRACDHLTALLANAEAGAHTSPAPDGEAVIAAMQRFMAADAGTDLPAAPPAAPESGTTSGTATAINDCWHISIRFGRDVLRNGMEPLAFLRYLQSLGEIVYLATLTDAMPDADEMDPEACYLGFEIAFRSPASKDEIEQVFMFVRDDCALHILPPNSRISDYIELIEALPEETLRLGEILVRCGALTEEELADGLALQQPGSASGTDALPEDAPIGEILVQQRVVQQEIVDAAAARQKTVAERKAAEARLIRVQADKLDQLIDLVGELVIAGASTSLLAQKSRQTALVEATSVLSRLVENIRDSALQLRMVQIGETFNRFQRVVRDVSRELGKDIELVVTGGETELDKSVVERIGDPLLHLVRNAIDHGIEPAEVRLAHGKPARGRLELNASHDSGSIVVEVRDDGNGLNQARILAKAVERGIVPAGQALSDAEICNLIFEPGFSTAESVTNLSGRGVGMDVVRKNIQTLRGSVEVSSTEGAGSRFTIRLPLTLAIIDGFLVGVGGVSYVIPMESVVECLALQHAGDRDYFDLRGEVLPFVRLRELFGQPGPAPARENVIVVKCGGTKVGIVVDVLHGEFQTVIKPLATLFRHLHGIGGSTILGSGEVALILDVEAVSRIAAGSERQRLLTATET